MLRSEIKFYRARVTYFPKIRPSSLLAIKIKQNSFYCCTSEIFYVGNVAPLFYWTLLFFLWKSRDEYWSFHLSHSLTLIHWLSKKVKIFDISLKASSLATHGMTEKTKVSQFRLTSEIINAFIHNKWTMGVRFGNKFCRKKLFVVDCLCWR